MFGVGGCLLLCLWFVVADVWALLVGWVLGGYFDWWVVYCCVVVCVLLYVVRFEVGCLVMV